MPALRLALMTIAFLVLNSGTANAQHCAAITDSFLSGIKIKPTTSGFAFDLQYAKTGGRPKPAYQAYLIAFRDSNSNEIASLTPQQAIAKKLCAIVGTKIAKQSESGSYGARYYDVRWEIDSQEFAKSLLLAEQLSEDRIRDDGTWKFYRDPIRMAVFIPFLDDRDYANIEGLPDDKHECNYGSESALLYETLPHWLSFRFGPNDPDAQKKKRNFTTLTSKANVRRSLQRMGSRGEGEGEVACCEVKLEVFKWLNFEHEFRDAGPDVFDLYTRPMKTVHPGKHHVLRSARHKHRVR